LINVSSLNIKLGNFSLKEVNLTVAKKQCLVIIGPNGCGKTTILECIAGLHACNGRVVIDEVDVSALPPEERRVGYVPQDFVLFPHLTADQNIEFGLMNKKNRSRDEVKRVIGLLGIEHLAGRNIRTLSAGEKQKVALARALAVNPKVLLLDEPLSALDPLTKEKLRRDLKSIITQILSTLDVPIIYVTHDIPEAIMMSDKIAVMSKGKIEQVGLKTEIFDQPSSRFVAEFLGFNVADGKIRATNTETADIDVNGMVIQTTKQGLVNGQKVTIAIEPHNIILSIDSKITRQKWKTCQCNTIQGTVAEIANMGAITRIIVDAGIQLKSDMSTEMIEELELTVGSKVFAQFKTQKAKIILK
jgi:ABC-type Fe3+/spermidine/putrescine transport system ATPase subunit